MPQESIEGEFDQTKVNGEESKEILQYKEELRDSLAKLDYGHLYIVGRTWIKALKAVFVGLRFTLIPVTHAAAPPPPPEKPPPMKYKDLPLYKSPHSDYKEYLADKEKCPKAKVKLIHEYLLPCVKCCRKSAQESYCEVRTEFQSIKTELCNAINTRKKEFKKYMRDPENLQLRRATMGLGAVTGFYMGSGKGIPRRMFFTSLGVVAAGALCFPKETDEYFRNFSYYSGKLAISLCNSWCGKEYTMRERLPLKEDVPPSKPRIPNKCPQKSATK